MDSKLERQIEEAMNNLNPRQRRFVQEIAGGDVTQEIAAIRAGYSRERAHSTASRMLATNGKIQHAIALQRKQYALLNGITAAWKRQKLVDIAEQASTPGELYNPSVAVKAVHELNLMDGHHKALEVKHSHLKVNVNLDYQIDLPERVIEGEVNEEKQLGQ